MLMLLINGFPCAETLIMVDNETQVELTRSENMLKKLFVNKQNSQVGITDFVTYLNAWEWSLSTPQKPAGCLKPGVSKLEEPGLALRLIWYYL